MATDKEEKITSPPESLQDKTAFIFNNLSQLNLQQKCDEIRDIVTEEYWPWMAQYLVMKRASIELNFHALYSNFLDCLKVPEVNKMVTRETFRNIKVLLRSDKGIANFSDRSLLKNLGHWLGMLTLGRNNPIFHVITNSLSTFFFNRHSLNLINFTVQFTDRYRLEESSRRGVSQRATRTPLRSTIRC